MSASDVAPAKGHSGTQKPPTGKPGKPGTPPPRNKPQADAAAKKGIDQNKKDAAQKKQDEKKGTITAIGAEGAAGRKSPTTLQVVGTPTHPEPAFTHQFGNDGPTLSITGKTGGTAKATIKISTSTPARQEIAFGKDLSSKPGAGWKKGVSLPVEMPAQKWDKFKIFPHFVSPERYFGWGRGEDDAVKKVVIENFPSHELSISLSGAAFKKKSTEKGKTPDEEWAEKWAKYAKARPLKFEKKVEPPSGSVGIKVGWREQAGSPKVGFAVELNAALTLFSASASIKLCLLEIVTAGALTSIGFVPPLSTQLANLGTEYLADVYIQVAFNGKIAINGHMTPVFFSDGGHKGTAALNPSATGTFTASIGARAGHSSWACVSVEGAATASLVAEGPLSANGSGIEWAPALKVPPIELSLTWEAKAGKISIKGAKKWEVTKEHVYWQPKPYKYP